MNYEKLYKEALERAKRELNSPDKRLIEFIFPELKESDDERIKKSLLDYLHTLPNHFSHNGSLVIDWIAWLEKQGKKESIKTCAEYYNKDRELKMPVLSEFQDKLADILMHREYDGPGETEDDIAKGRLEYELEAIRLSEELLPLTQKEQKPAEWSEEDEKMLDNAIGAIGAAEYYTYDDKQEIENWLKSLKDRVQPQPKQEWSEEDEQYLLVCKNA